MDLVVKLSGNLGTFTLPVASHITEAVVKDDAQLDDAKVDDAKLIDESLAGDSSAFGRLVTKHQDRLYNTLVYVTGSAEDARDVAQDAFVQAFVKLDSFKRSCAFYTWLYRIALNLAISRRRRHKPTVSVDDLKERCGGEPIDEGACPGDRVEGQERARAVHAALETLSEEHRGVLVLREMEGHDYDTISQMLEIPVGTVRSRIHRGRILLREELKQTLQQE